MRVFGGRPDRVGSGSVPTVHRERRTTVRSVGSESRSLHTPFDRPAQWSVDPVWDNTY